MRAQAQEEGVEEEGVEWVQWNFQKEVQRREVALRVRNRAAAGAAVAATVAVKVKQKICPI